MGKHRKCNENDVKVRRGDGRVSGKKHRHREDHGDTDGSTTNRRRKLAKTGDPPRKEPKNRVKKEIRHAAEYARGYHHRRDRDDMDVEAEAEPKHDREMSRRERKDQRRRDKERHVVVEHESESSADDTDDFESAVPHREHKKRRRRDKERLVIEVHESDDEEDDVDDESDSEPEPRKHKHKHRHCDSSRRNVEPQPDPPKQKHKKRDRPVEDWPAVVSSSDSDAVEPSPKRRKKKRSENKKQDKDVSKKDKKHKKERKKYKKVTVRRKVDSKKRHGHHKPKREQVSRWTDESDDDSDDDSNDESDDNKVVKGRPKQAEHRKKGKPERATAHNEPKKAAKGHPKERSKERTKAERKKQVEKLKKKSRKKAKKDHVTGELPEQVSPWEDEPESPPKKDKRRKKHAKGDDDMHVDDDASSSGRKPWEPTADERLDYQRRKEGGLMPEPMYDVNAPRLSKAKARERRKAFEEKKVFACDRCPCSYTRKDTLKQHIDYKHLGKGKCSRCDEVLCSAQSLRRHLFTAHQVGEPDHSQEDRTCGKCGNVYVHRHTMLTHVRYIHKGAGRCPKCPKVLAGPTALKTHLRTQHEIGGQKYCYLCMCGQAFTAKSSLVVHARRHSKKFLEKYPYHCPDCWRCFQYKSQLMHHNVKWHQLVPVRKEAHICAQCPIGRKARFHRFVTKRGWRMHHEVHHNPYPRFVCDKCFKPYGSAAALRQHVNWSRSCGSKPDTRPTCRHCGQSFTQKVHLRVHRRNRVCD